MEKLLVSSKPELRRLATEAMQQGEINSYPEGTKGKVRPIGKRRFKKRLRDARIYSKRMRSMG